MKNALFYLLVLAGLVALVQMAPFEDPIDDPEEAGETTPWRSYLTEIDLSTGENTTHPAISYDEILHFTREVDKKKLTISSLGYPEAYPKRYLHIWKIYSKPGHFVKLTFNKIFDVEYDGKRSCDDDYLQIDDYMFNMKFCGYNHPPVYVSKSNSGVTVTFSSDKTHTGRGFAAVVEQVAEVKPQVTMLFKDGTELKEKTSTKAGKVTIFCHVAGGIDAAYQFKFGCGSGGKATPTTPTPAPNATTTTTTTNDEVDDFEGTVYMSVDDKNKYNDDADVDKPEYHTFPAITADLKKGDQICSCSATDITKRYTLSKKVTLHVI